MGSAPSKSTPSTRVPSTSRKLQVASSREDSGIAPGVLRQQQRDGRFGREPSSSSNKLSRAVSILEASGDLTLSLQPSRTLSTSTAKKAVDSPMLPVPDSTTRHPAPTERTPKPAAASPQSTPAIRIAESQPTKKRSTAGQRRTSVDTSSTSNRLSPAMHNSNASQYELATSRQFDEQVEQAQHLQQQVERAEDVFEQFAAVIFRRAETKGNGLLEPWEYQTICQSSTLNLNLEDKDAQRLFKAADKDRDGKLRFEEFVPLLRKLLQLAYADISSAETDWIRIGFSGYEEDALPIFFNKKTGAMTYTTPPKFLRLEDEETPTQFEYFAMSDGVVITTYVDDQGQRLYLDSEQQAWKVVPREWENQMEPWQEYYGSFDDYFAANHNHPQRHGLNYQVIRHPVNKKEYYSCASVDYRTVRLYLDEDQQLRPLPIAWEALLPETQSALQQISKAIPTWESIQEQVLALRLNNYDVTATINWKSAEMQNWADRKSKRSRKEEHNDALLIASLQQRLQMSERQMESAYKDNNLLRARLQVLENQLLQARHSAEESRRIVERQAKRIFLLEEQSESFVEETSSQLAVEERNRYLTAIQELEAKVAALERGDQHAVAHTVLRQEQQLSLVRVAESQLRVRLHSARQSNRAKIGRLVYSVEELGEQNKLVKQEMQLAVTELRTLAKNLAFQIGKLHLQLAGANKDNTTLRSKY
ncbi:uncharacterized protein MONBRDRAFT_34520, partial [Monosiga brevicollis MX1]